MGLQNRFVVAMSRARLGFFVIGSVKAVVNNRNGLEGPAHWRRFVSSLNPQVENKWPSTDGSRCGNELPICCPRHGKKVMLNITKVSDFPTERQWNKFCSLACQAVLDRCGHLCKLPCHSPVDIQHNTKCMKSLERPCETHASVPLLCYEVDIVRSESLAEALNRFDCKEMVYYRRPECGHNVRLHCFEKKKMNKGYRLREECSEIVPYYIHPVCGHHFKQPKCATKRRYESNNPNCPQDVIHERPCGCKLKMQCYEKVQELQYPIDCTLLIEIARPRCGHMLSMECYKAIKLKEEWAKQVGKSAIKNRKLLFIVFTIAFILF